MARLRSAYFAQAGDTAARFGVSFERVVQHLWAARRTNRRLIARSVAHVEDLVHAIACVDDQKRAWTELADRYERHLVRRFRGGHDEVGATVIVRKLFADLRRRNLEAWDFKRPSLRGYTGMRPLRNWLADRLQAIAAQELIANAEAQAQRSATEHAHETANNRRGDEQRPRRAAKFEESALRLTAANGEGE